MRIPTIALCLFVCLVSLGAQGQGRGRGRDNEDTPSLSWVKYQLLRVKFAVVLALNVSTPHFSNSDTLKLVKAVIA